MIMPSFLYVSHFFVFLLLILIFMSLHTGVAIEMIKPSLYLISLLKEYTAHMNKIDWIAPDLINYIGMRLHLTNGEKIEFFFLHLFVYLIGFTCVKRD